MKPKRHLRGITQMSFFGAFAYLDALIDSGYSPRLLDAWLDHLYDGVVVGMPAQLVLDYYGAPVFRNEIVYQGLSAQLWVIPVLPGRVTALTVPGGKVVRVRR